MHGAIVTNFRTVQSVTDMDANVWLTAHAVYDPDRLRQLINAAVDAYKRSPGLNDPTRIYGANVGFEVLQILSEVLRGKLLINADEDTSQFVCLRVGLRAHLRHTLQTQLMHDGYSSEVMKEDLLALDLGL
jgi:hypothetical protein